MDMEALERVEALTFDLFSPTGELLQGKAAEDNEEL